MGSSGDTSWLLSLPRAWGTCLGAVVMETCPILCCTPGQGTDISIYRGKVKCRISVDVCVSLTLVYSAMHWF